MAVKISVFGVATQSRTAAWTQTYSTGTRTVTNLSTVSMTVTTPTFTYTGSLVDSTTSTNSTPWGYATDSQANSVFLQINNIVADLATLKGIVSNINTDITALKNQNDNNITDITNGKKTFTQLLDDLQGYGWEQ